MRRLIINADDLGLTAGVNRGIGEAQGEGVVTAATLMAKGRAFDDAVQWLKSRAEFSVGCHVVLLDGEPLLAPELVPTLVDSGAGFRGSVGEFARAVLTGRINADEVAAEAAAQIRKLQQAGLVLSHVDTHKHAHMFPAVLEPLLRAAHACGIRAIRNPYAPSRPLQLSKVARRPQLWTRYAEVQVLRRLGTKFRARIEAQRMVTTDGTFGILGTGALDLELFRAIVGCVPEGTWELVCHPGYNDGDLGQVRTRLRASRQRELEVLMSPEARRIVEERGIQLISYRDLINETASGEPARSN